jgi:mono/diheme cytochrome c family protein
MEPSRDNPFLRFKAFVLGIGTFLLFAVLLGVIWLFTRQDPQNLEELAAAVRLEKRAAVVAAQQASLSSEFIDSAVETVSHQLVAAKPVAVEDPAQLVPGSRTAMALVDAPEADFSAVDAMTDPSAAVDPAVMAAGQTSYIVCSGCHGPNGEGGPVGPPLAGSEWVNGPVSNLIRIQMRGLEGPISVGGVDYTFPAPMTPLAHQTNEEIAGVLTFIRNSFGNQAPPVTPEQVEALRSEVGKPMLTVGDLIPPVAAP